MALAEYALKLWRNAVVNTSELFRRVNDLSRSASPAESGSPGAAWNEEEQGLSGHGIVDFAGMAITPGAWTGLSLTAENRAGQPLAGRRFAALSSLPPGHRLPPKREGLLPRAPAPTAELSPPPASAPVQLPQVMLPPAESRQMGFNCPSCFTVLIIKDPAAYDGHPAPCPTCGIRILPPQRVPDSPFSVVHRTPRQLPPLLEG